MIEGTPRYHAAVKWAHENLDDEGIALHHKVNDPTPWIIDAKLPETNSCEWFDLMDWCEEKLGPESWPIHDRPGVWYRSKITLYEHTDVGFSTKEHMETFIAAWPQYVWEN